jgi:hypothetical protein
MPARPQRCQTHVKTRSRRGDCCLREAGVEEQRSNERVVRLCGSDPLLTTRAGSERPSSAATDGRIADHCSQLFRIGQSPNVAA